MNDEKEAWVKQYRPEECVPMAGIHGRFKRYSNPSKPGQRLISALGVLAPFEDMGWHSTYAQLQRRAIFESRAWSYPGCCYKR